MRLVITDLTEMHGGNYCVAGWCAQQVRMIRPLPNGNNWTAGLLQQHGISPGVTIDFQQGGQRLTSIYPHRTEDTHIDPATIQSVSCSPVPWFGAAAPPAHTTVAAVFGGQLQHNSIWNNIRQGVHVQAGSQIGSLGAVEIPRRGISFVEEFGKLKAIVNDGIDEYKVAVSSLVLKDAWRQGGIQAVRQALPPSPRLHVRVGLARPFGNPPDKCYLMINGIHG